MCGGMDVQGFVESQLPEAPARVLEVGCGRGQLALSLAQMGYRITAIDPRAPKGAIFEAVSLEELADPGPFAAVVASRSLHHIPDLPGALAKLARLLRPGGRLILDEHAFDRFDEPTARWYLEQRAATDPNPRSLEHCRADWEAEHAGLHGYAAMRHELDRRFTERFFTWTPFLHGELHGAVDAREEQSLIDAGAIQAMGFRYVGETR